jgi:ABC-2 type transport system ATP-binding protein
LRGLAAQGTAVLVSSHILTELEEIADRVVFVSGGRAVGEHIMGELRGGATAWRVRAVNQRALLAALESRGLPADTEAVAAALPAMTEEEAANLLSDLVAEGIRVVEYGPAGSRLESAYLALTEERR